MSVKSGLRLDVLKNNNLKRIHGNGCENHFKQKIFILEVIKKGEQEEHYYEET